MQAEIRHQVAAHVPQTIGQTGAIHIERLSCVSCTGGWIRHASSRDPIRISVPRPVTVDRHVCPQFLGSKAQAVMVDMPSDDRRSGRLKYA